MSRCPYRMFYATGGGSILHNIGLFSQDLLKYTKFHALSRHHNVLKKHFNDFIKMKLGAMLCLGKYLSKKFHRQF